MLTTLSYPEFDARGERKLPSLYLEGLMRRPRNRARCGPQPRHPPAVRGPAEIRAPGLLEFLREKTARLSPTDLESFLQCPFQYFGRRTLRLKPAPAQARRPARFPHAGKHRSRSAGGMVGGARGT